MHGDRRERDSASGDFPSNSSRVLMGSDWLSGVTDIENNHCSASLLLVQPVSSWFSQSRITERTKDQKKATTSRHISRHRRNLQAPTVCCKDIKEEIPVPHSLSSWANSLHSPYTPCSPPQTLYSSTNSVHFNTHFLCPSLLPAVLC